MTIRTWFSPSIRTLREVDLVLPVLPDMYEMHQLVWSMMKDVAGKPVKTFLYSIKNSIVTVRGDFNRGRSVVTRAKEGELVDVSVDVALFRDEWTLHSQREKHLERFVKLLGRAGLDVQEMQAFDCRIEQGIKYDKKTGATLDIRLPVFKTKCTALVVDEAKLKDALRDGIGRGRRFGCGMLKISAKVEQSTTTTPATPANAAPTPKKQQQKQRQQRIIGSTVRVFAEQLKKAVTTVKRKLLVLKKPKTETDTPCAVDPVKDSHRSFAWVVLKRMLHKRMDLCA